MKNQYVLRGSGKKTTTADKALEGDRSKLVAKLEKADASTKLKVKKTVYQGNYRLIEGNDGDRTSIIVTAESKKGWEYLAIKAAKRIHTEDYSSSFNIEQYITLSGRQQKALGPNKPKPPAGLMDCCSSSDSYSSFLRR